MSSSSSDEISRRDYIFRVPFSSSIYPRLTREETLSALANANGSRPAHKRFPAEILFLINKELHSNNSIYEEIRSTWSVHAIDPDYGSELLDGLSFDINTKTFYTPNQPNSESSNGYQSRGKPTLSDSISSPDLLYRLRCFFPENDVYSMGPDGYKVIWMAAIRHKKSGSRFDFFEHKGSCMVAFVMRWDDIDTEDDAPQTKENTKTALTTDVIQLLNALFGTVDGRRFAYYHPAADADYPTADERYLAVPNARLLERVNDEDLMPYRFWCPVKISRVEDLSSFKSLLPHMKYNIESREVDLVNGTEDLTTIISSSLLFYRLLCHYRCPDTRVNDTPPITSVWRVKLTHRRSGASIIVMDNRGLFDIRADDDTSVGIGAVIPLVNALLSDECCHPYDGVVAGTVA